VVVPESVSYRWTASMIRIARKDAPVEGKVYELAADGSIEEDDGRLKVIVGQYLPDFFMDDRMVSSKGDEPNNPTVRLTVYAGEEVIYTGWAFEKYPEMHAFVHPKYTISLVGGVEKK
jgi:hypothetical protein